MVSDHDQRQLVQFLDSEPPRPLLGLVYGRRRIGKSTLLLEETEAREGFYFEAIHAETPVQLERLGAAIGDRLGVARIALDSWEHALVQLLQLDQERAMPVVLDEFGHILQADPSVASVLASTIGPGARRRGQAGRSRVVLCGSAIAMMRALTVGEAPLRGRAGLELVIQPDDFRTAATRLEAPEDPELAARVFAVIGGVVGYATDMVNDDLPTTIRDFERWIVDRVLSPAAPLHYEATTLLAEDPSLAGGSDLLHHSILGAIANGSVTAGNIAKRVGRAVPNLAPALNRLVEAGFVTRHVDPVRKQRPVYALADPYLQFHYAVLEPHRTALRSRDRGEVWRERLIDTFNSHVRGPVFEQQARTWVERFASQESIGGAADHVGPSVAHVDKIDVALDVVVAASGDDPSARTIIAIGEAKAGEALTQRHLHRLERARSALGPRASTAKLLLFGVEFHEELRKLDRHDLELIDLERLYNGQ